MSCQSGPCTKTEVGQTDSTSTVQLVPGLNLLYSISDMLLYAGTQEEESEFKKGFKVPRLPMANADLARLINSDEIQSVVNAPKSPTHRHVQKKNPLKNVDAMLKLNPYQEHIRRQEQDNAVCS